METVSCIRHELHKEISRKTIEEINREALKKFMGWQQRYSANEVAPKGITPKV